MNPFLINKYGGPNYFCDRIEEINALIKSIDNQDNTAFFAQRRIGKTALIHHLFYKLKKRKINCIYIDIFSSRELKDFADQLAGAIYKEFPIQHNMGKRFWDAIKLLRPTVSVNELTGAPELSLDISKPQQIEKSIPQLLRFLDDQHAEVIIAIDEFQQILEYPEKNVEALLRTHIQTLKNIRFIFLGSNRNMMLEIFNNAKRPFYASTKNLYIGKINNKEYGDFIKKTFKKGGMSITSELTKQIIKITKGHTYYTQRLCHEIYAENKKKIDEKLIFSVLNKIVLENESIYYQYRNMLTATQWRILKALAIEEKTEKPYSQKFLKKHKLTSPSIVKRALEALINKDLVYYDIMQKQAYYEIQDKFLMRWLQYKK